MKKRLKLLYLMLFSSVLLFSCKDTIESSNAESSIKDSSSIEDSSNSDDSSSSIKDSSSSSNDDSSSSENNSSDSSQEEVYVTLDTPTLTLNSDNGVVTIGEVDNSAFYRYYINSGEYNTTTSNTITLTDGQTLVVCADNTNEYILPSNWSDPITYFEKESQASSMVTIFLNDSPYNSVEIKKGTTYTPSTPNAKEGYTFDNWYVDPFYTEVFDPTTKIEEDTILYAHYTKDKCIENTTYWVKANSYISHPNQAYYAGSSWKFIPLTLEENSNPKIFSATVQVTNTTDTSYGQFLVMDGFDDTAGRTYWKNGSSDFTIKTDGTYKINFSLEKEWLDGSKYVHANVEQISATYKGRRPLYSNDEMIPELSVPVVTIDKEKNLASWTIQDNATYAYQIDNGEVKYTNDNNVSLYENSFIVVKAIAANGSFLDSKWSSPYIYIIEYEPEAQYCYVYFFESGLPTVKVKKGDKVSKPTNPTKSKYVFDNWYTTINKTTVFDFDTKINKNTVVYPKWTPLEDYKTTVYYTLEKADGTKVGDLLLYENNVSYNEYHVSYSLTSSETLYVKRVSDGKKFGPYQMASTGTYDMYFSEEHIWEVNTENARNAYWALQELTIYFSNSTTWTDVYYYVWDSSNTPKSPWPGEKMTYVRSNSYGQDIYKATINTAVYKHIIFNGGKGRSQTVDISLSSLGDNNAFYATSKNADGKYEVEPYKYS